MYKLVNITSLTGDENCWIQRSDGTIFFVGEDLNKEHGPDFDVTPDMIKEFNETTVVMDLFLNFNRKYLKKQFYKELLEEN